MVNSSWSIGVRLFYHGHQVSVKSARSSLPLPENGTGPNYV